MGGDFLKTEMDRFDPSAPLAAAWTPPASWYTDPRFLERERRSVFRRSWQAVGRTDQVRGPGDFFTGSLLGDPFVVLRKGDGNLAAFFNVCRHHAAAVCSGSGCAEELTCPYHGWTYALDGRLLRAPRMGKSDLLEPGRFGLLPVACASWGPLVFIHLGENPAPFGGMISDLERRLPATDVSRLRFVRRRSYDLRCNWKVYVDNYLDGGYHVAGLHRGLAGQLDLRSYRTEIFQRLSIQSCPPSSAAGEKKAGPGKRMGEGALYAWVYPNFMINRYGPVMDTNLVVPLTQETTRVVFDFYFEKTEGKEAEEFIDRSIALSHEVQEEDVAISESVQAGLSSTAYDRGIYAPAFEAPMFHFHRLLASDLRDDG